MKGKRILGMLGVALLPLGGAIAAENRLADTIDELAPASVLIETTDLQGRIEVNENPGQATSPFTGIKLVDGTGAGFSLREYEDGGRVYSVTQKENFCLVVARSAGEPGLKRLVSKDDAGNVTVNLSYGPDLPPGTCGGCAWYKSGAWSDQTQSCSVPCPGCWCGYCDIHPCTPDPDPIDPDFPEIDPDMGWNSPVVDGAEIGGQAFHELSLLGKANPVGLTLTDPGRLADPGASPQTLVGTTFGVSDAAGNRYEVHITGLGTAKFWTGTRDAVPTYVMSATSIGQPQPRPLCTGGRNEAVLYTGDRYDAATRTISATGADAKGWINIACDGTALEKLYLTRHTEASQQVTTTRAERQAMLKMFTDDVYGDGVTFTVPGQPLLWQDAKGITTYQSKPRAVEALWNEHGAVCLNDPRRPDQAVAIESHGKRPPRCSDAMLSTPGLGYVVSAHPNI